MVGDIFKRFFSMRLFYSETMFHARYGMKKILMAISILLLTITAYAQIHIQTYTVEHAIDYNILKLTGGEEGYNIGFECPADENG